MGAFKNQNANPSVRRVGEGPASPAYGSRNTPRSGPSFTTADERSEMTAKATNDIGLSDRGLHHDRRNYSGDFNGPGGTFSMTSHGYADDDRWSGMSHAAARPEVHNYYRNQKDTSTWKEATRLAKSRTDAQFRRQASVGGPVSEGLHGGHYANAYQENLVRVMAVKGKGIAEAAGELNPRHPQSGYGRT